MNYSNAKEMYELHEHHFPLSIILFDKVFVENENIGQSALNPRSCNHSHLL